MPSTRSVHGEAESQWFPGTRGPGPIPPTGPVHSSRWIQLRDGQSVRIRPIRPDDAGLLVEFHSRLSARSRYQRFLGPKPRLSRREARYFASVDFRDRMALVAVAPEGGEERVVAVARFDRLNEERAELAVCVRDDYQGLGLGTALCRLLGDAARERGIRALTAIALADNYAVLTLAERLGARVEGDDFGTVSLTWEPVG